MKFSLPNYTLHSLTYIDSTCITVVISAIEITHFCVLARDLLKTETGHLNRVLESLKPILFLPLFNDYLVFSFKRIPSSTVLG